MKIKHLLTIAIAAYSINLGAQTYEFSYSNAEYNDLVGSTSLNNGSTWDDPSFNIPIGFDFELYDNIINEIEISEVGLGGILAPPVTVPVVPAIVATSVDLIDRGYDFEDESAPSLSNISYLLDGAPGSQILKIEWNNAGFYGDLDEHNVSTDFMNMQLWLYEGSNTIEMRYGPSNIEYPQFSYEGEPGPFVGLLSGLDLINEIPTGELIVLINDPAAPISIPKFNVEDIPSLNGTIPDGMVYTFSKVISNVQEVDQYSDLISIFPNPTEDLININIEGDNLLIDQVTIYNALGKEVLITNDTRQAIDLSDLADGIYLVKISTDKGLVTKRVTKN